MKERRRGFSKCLVWKDMTQMGRQRERTKVGRGKTHRRFFGVLTWSHPWCLWRHLISFDLIRSLDRSIWLGVWKWPLEFLFNSPPPLLLLLLLPPRKNNGEYQEDCHEIPSCHTPENHQGTYTWQENGTEHWSPGKNNNENFYEGGGVSTPEITMVTTHFPPY